MPTTATHAIPYPAPVGVAPDVPYWMQQLAERVDTKLTAALVKPAATLTRSSATTVASGGYQKVPLNTAETNRGGMADTGTSRLTVTRAGLYDISACVAFASNATGARYTAVYKNGAIVRFAVGPALSGGPTAYPVTFPLELAAGDYLELYGVQDSGAGLSTQNTPHTATYLSAVFVED